MEAMKDARTAAPVVEGARLAPRLVDERVAARVLRLIERKAGNWQDLLSPIAPRSSVEAFIASDLATLGDAQLRNLVAKATVELSNIHSRSSGRARFRSCDWRLLTFCFAKSATLGEAIQHMADLCEAVDGRMGSIELRLDGERAHVCMGGERGDDPELAFTVILNAVVLFHEIFGWLVGRPIEGEGYLDFPEECRVWADEGVLPFPLKLGSDFCGFSMPADLLDSRIVRNSADFAPQMMPRALFSYAVESEPHEIANRARMIMRTMLREEAALPTLEQLAKILSIGLMTLRRRLASAETSFQEIRDSVRREYALELLERDNQSIEQLTQLLDFCDSNAFRVAVKGWTGLSPTEYRRRAREQAAAR